MDLQMQDNQGANDAATTEDTTALAASDNAEALAGDAVDAATQTGQTYQPFSKGKERFKIDGEDVDLDWDSAKKYVSLGKTAYKRMQEAAEQKKQVETTWNQLVDLARKDPDTLLRVFNPNYQSQANAQQGAVDPTKQTDADPRDQELRTVRQELQELRSAQERSAIAEERKMIENEINQAVSKFPVLKDDEFALTYLKQEYKKALQAGMDVSIEDVAFYVSQKLQDRQKQKVQQTQQRLEQKRKQSPVTAISSGAEGGGQKPMSLDDVKKLAGRF